MGPRSRGDDRQTPCPCFLGAGDGGDTAATEQGTEFLATAPSVGARGLGAWMPARSVVRRRRGPCDAHPRDPGRHLHRHAHRRERQPLQFDYS